MNMVNSTVQCLMNVRTEPEEEKGGGGDGEA